MRSFCSENWLLFIFLGICVLFDEDLNLKSPRHNASLFDMYIDMGYEDSWERKWASSD